MADKRIHYTEKMVGAGHPLLADTLNRMMLVEHSVEGTHDVATLNIERISADPPTLPQPYHRWYDTDNSKEYMRNRANDAWVESSKISAGVTDPTVKYTVPRATQVEMADDSSLLNGHTGAWYVPPGAIMAFGTQAPPDGWLLCDGRAVNRTGNPTDTTPGYSTLFAAIGTNFGSGDGIATFNIPNLIDRFVRGVDNSTRVVGNYQEDDYKSHSHDTGFGNTAGSGSRYVPAGINGTGTINTAASPTTGGTETRPKNVGVLYCIKY